MPPALLAAVTQLLCAHLRLSLKCQACSAHLALPAPLHARVGHRQAVLDQRACRQRGLWQQQKMTSPSLDCTVP